MLSVFHEPSKAACILRPRPQSAVHVIASWLQLCMHTLFTFELSVPRLMLALCFGSPVLRQKPPHIAKTPPHDCRLSKNFPLHMRNLYQNCSTKIPLHMTTLYQNPSPHDYPLPKPLHMTTLYQNTSLHGFDLACTPTPACICRQTSSNSTSALALLLR